jgi:hypothetical protein
MLQLLRDYMEGLLRFREKSAFRPWIDIRFSDFVANPLGEVERIHAEAGMTLVPEARREVARWVEEHPRQDLVRARPADLTPYGIDPDAALAAFAEYVQRFDVAIDGV